MHGGGVLNDLVEGTVWSTGGDMEGWRMVPTKPLHHAYYPPYEIYLYQYFGKVFGG